MTLVPMAGHAFRANPTLAGSWPEVYAGMGITAEILAARYAIGRTAQDAFAADSHGKAAAAQGAGRFAAEIVPVEAEWMETEGGRPVSLKTIVSADEGVRPDTTVETLGKLKPAFKIDGTVTAGNSSQMTDGAAFVQLQDEFRQAFEMTILDLPRNMLINFPHLLEEVGVVTLVTELTLASARDTIRILSWLKANAPAATPMIVCNKVPQGTTEISKADFEASIERKVNY